MTYQVTLTTANTVYNLLTLVRAIDPNFVDCGIQISLQSDPGNTSGQYVKGGQDSNVSTTRYGWSLTPGDSWTVPKRSCLANLNVFATANTQLLNIEVTR